MDREIYIYTDPAEIEHLRKAGRLAATVLELVCRQVAPGVSTATLDRFAEQWIYDHGAIPTFKGYLGFPCTLCVAINQEVVHGIPSPKRILKEGDIISIDVGVTLTVGQIHYIGDNAKTVPVGSVPDKLLRLIEDTKQALELGVQQCQAGKHISDIAHIIEREAQSKRYGSVKEFGGHGIGPKYHSAPFIPNYTAYFQEVPDTLIQPGMVLAIEPMFTLGLDQIRKLHDNWTIVTRDNKPAAHHEYSVLVTESGPEILTVIDAGLLP